jgi:hypothetical protein
MHIIHNQQEQKICHKGTLSSKCKLPQDNYPTVQRTTGQLPNGPTDLRTTGQLSNGQTRTYQALHLGTINALWKIQRINSKTQRINSLSNW